MHPDEHALHDYVDGVDRPSERPALEQHLAACASCRRLVDDLREIQRALATLEPRDPPVRVWSRVERAIMLEREHGAESARGSEAARGVRKGDIAGANARSRDSRA